MIFRLRPFSNGRSYDGTHVPFSYMCLHGIFEAFSPVRCPKSAVFYFLLAKGQGN
jgi:hypothetical protein